MSNPGEEGKKPQAEWITVEYRDSDGNPTLPRNLVASTYRRLFSEVPQDTVLEAHVLAGCKPSPLLMVERKLYEVHRLSVRGWRRRGQLAVELDAWRQHEGAWFEAMRGIALQISDPGLPGPHNEESGYVVTQSSFKRKIVTSVDEEGTESNLNLHEGILDIEETLRSAWKRQAAEVLNMGFKLLLAPLFVALGSGLTLWCVDRPRESGGGVADDLENPAHRVERSGETDLGNEVSTNAVGERSQVSAESQKEEEREPPSVDSPRETTSEAGPTEEEASPNS